MQGMLLVLWLPRESVCGALLDENEQETMIMNDPIIPTCQAWEVGEHNRTSH